jgi:hypothetical protein
MPGKGPGSREVKTISEPWQMMPGRATGALLNEMVRQWRRNQFWLFRVGSLRAGQSSFLIFLA